MTLIEIGMQLIKVDPGHTVSETDRERANRISESVDSPPLESGRER